MKRVMQLPAVLTMVALVAVVSGCELTIGDQHEATGHEVTQQRDVGAVTTVELRSSGTLNVAVGDTPSLSVTAKSDLIDDITTVVDGDTLVIDLDHNWGATGFLEYDLVVPALSTVVLSGSGEVYGALGATDAASVTIEGSGDVGLTDLDADAVTLTVEGSGTITAPHVAAQGVSVVVDGSGEVEVDGTADRVDVSVPGSGAVRAAQLAARDGKVSIGGSGEVAVNASGTLDVSISGSGDVGYVGDPRLTTHVDGSGEIHQR